MYPNPISENATLMIKGLTEKATITLIDALGKTIITQTITPNQEQVQIKTNNLASDVYYIRIVSDEVSKTEKLIVR